MADRPTAYPAFATGDDYPHDAAPEQDTPTKVEPVSGKKATGFRPGEFPPAPELNYQLWLLNAWVEYLDGIDTGEYEIAIPAKAFEAVILGDPGPGGLFNPGIRNHTEALPFVADIQLPVGTRIKSIRFFYHRNGAGTITPSLRRSLLSTLSPAPAAVTGGTGPADSSSSGVQDVDVTGINHEIESGYGYLLYLDSTSASNSARGAILTIDRPPA